MTATEELIKSKKPEQILMGHYLPGLGGTELFIKSPRIHKFVQGMSVKDSAGNPIMAKGEEFNTPLFKDLKFYKLPANSANFIKGPQDFIRQGTDYASCLLALTTLDEGVTIFLPGMIAKDTLDQVVYTLRERAMQLYKSFIAPYTVKFSISVNEEM